MASELIVSAIVRPIKPADADEVLSWRNHPDVRRFMFTSSLISRDSHKKWIKEALSEDRLIVRIVEYDGMPLGLVNFRSGADQSVADWGFYLVPGAMPGSGSILGQAALIHAFRTLNYQKICGQALETNVRSQRFHERMGFSIEGRLRKQFHSEGRALDILLYGMLKSEFESLYQF